MTATDHRDPSRRSSRSPRDRRLLDSLCVHALAVDAKRSVDGPQAAVLPSPPLSRCEQVGAEQQMAFVSLNVFQSNDHRKLLVQRRKLIGVVDETTTTDSRGWWFGLEECDLTTETKTVL